MITRRFCLKSIAAIAAALTTKISFGEWGPPRTTLKAELVAPDWFRLYGSKADRLKFYRCYFDILWPDRSPIRSREPRESHIINDVFPHCMYMATPSFYETCRVLGVKVPPRII